MTTITEPCVVPDMDEATYHADPVPLGSLSSGGARTLLKPGGPAKFAYWRDKEKHSTTFDIGKAVHTEALGAGAGLAIVDAPDWRTKKAKQAKADAYAAGQIPVLAEDYQRVRAMVAAIRQHPLAAALLASEEPAEQSLFWIDERTGAWCRARHDKTARDRYGRLLIVDVKTCESAHDDAFSKSASAYGYHQQEDWYCRAAQALGLDEDPGFLFIAVEKQPPHLVNVIQLDSDARDCGRRRNDAALALYAKCAADGDWPGYGTGITTVALPPYYPTQEY